MSYVPWLMTPGAVGLHGHWLHQLGESLGNTEQCSLTGQVNTQRYCEEVGRETEGGVGQGSCTI